MCATRLSISNSAWLSCWDRARVNAAPAEFEPLDVISPAPRVFDGADLDFDSLGRSVGHGPGAIEIPLRLRIVDPAIVQREGEQNLALCIAGLLFDLRFERRESLGR